MNNTKTAASSTAFSNASSNKPSAVENMLTQIKNNSNQNFQAYLIVVIPILMLLCFLIYKYNYSSRSESVIKTMGYKSNINLTPLDQCYKLNTKEQYKLCDYYICSSFMTPCVGNQHYDYVSTEMIAEVIKSGARYIQIPVCESDVTIHALPVVGTAVYGERVITSLNTLDMKTTLKVIRTNAFKIDNKPVNYPLIVHLVLNTNNANTISILADNISEIIGDVLIDATLYKDNPFYLDKLCNLLNKIIIIATPEYINTSLEKFIVPTMKLFNIYHFGELGPINMPKDNLYSNYYNQRLSSTQQDKSNKYFKDNYPTLDYILDNKDTIGNTILNDSNILNKLTAYNKFGLTVIKPLYPEDVITLNYNTEESIFYGCQITAMNFQLNDINMQNYLSIFKDSSFRLKPAGLRFAPDNDEVIDFTKIYKSVTSADTDIINNFNINNVFIVFESYALLNTYLTQIESNLSFNVGGNKTTDKIGNQIYNININQCFIPRISKTIKGNNQSYYFESAAQPGFFITLNSGTFNLENLATSNAELLKQTFYIEKPKIVDDDITNQMVSIRTVDDTSPLYLASENKIVKAYTNLTNASLYSNISFITHKKPFKYIIKIISIYDGIVKTMNDVKQLIGVLENNIEDGTMFYVKPINTSYNFNIFKDKFTLQNYNTKKYVDYDPINLFLYNNINSPTNYSEFKLEFENSYYKILNNNRQNLILIDKKNLKFGDIYDVKLNENLFKIDISYELS